jgi:small GTP-binding protein
VTLTRILTDSQNQLLQDERQLLTEVATALGRARAPADDLATLTGSIRQLDELFLLVVVGEFNSGKSAFINALLGQRVLAEGVTPTTSKIHLIRHGDSVTRRPVDAVQEEVTFPVELLRELTIVDTPGTNALDRRHEAVTSEFVPRSDLVMFVTSADRPFSESERAFLERVQSWGKKVVVLVNKVDIVDTADDIAEIERYILDHSRQLLAMEPPVFAISSRLALAARTAGDPEQLAASGLPKVEEYLHATLDDAGRVRLKLANPLGVAVHLLERSRDAADRSLETLAEDLRVLEDIERQIAAYQEDVHREFELRLADIDNLIGSMERRGLEFLDDRLRLRRLRTLLDSDRLRTDFERLVVADTPQRVENKVESLIDWLVAGSLRQWQAVVQRVTARQSLHAGRIVGEVGAGFESNRAGLLATVGRSARERLDRYDRSEEAQRVAGQVQHAITNTALVEVGAVGLGATISLIVSGSAADATGLVAAGTVAALGLYILPHRRKRAKRELREKLAVLRAELGQALGDGFLVEASRSQQGIRDTFAPYARFVRTERDRLTSDRDGLTALLVRVERLLARVDGLTAEGEVPR